MRSGGTRTIGVVGITGLLSAGAAVALAGGGLKTAPEFVRAGVNANEKVEGIVVTHLTRRDDNARVAASLHGLEPNARYALVGSTAGEGVNWAIRFSTQQAQDVFVTELLGSPAEAAVDRAVLYELARGGETRVSVFGLGGGVDDDR